MFYRFTGKAFARKTVDLYDLYRGGLMLCGGHPSINDEPLELLRLPGVTTMVMNNTATLIRPDLWVCADRPECYSPSILMDPAPLKFARLSSCNERIPPTNKKWIEMPNTLFYGLNSERKYPTVLWNASQLCWWKNVFMIALQISYRLGFRRIYCAGSALKISKGSQYAYGSPLSEKEIAYNARTYRMVLSQLKNCLPIFKAAGLEVVSVTPESALNDLVPFMSFREAIDEIRAGYPGHDTSAVVHSSNHNHGKED